MAKIMISLQLCKCFFQTSGIDEKIKILAYVLRLIIENNCLDSLELL